MNSDDTTVSHPILKVLSVWAVFGISTWAEAAAFAAFVYSCLLIVEFFWKKSAPLIAYLIEHFTGPKK